MTPRQTAPAEPDTAIGIDIGGTRTEVVCVARDGTIVWERGWLTEAEGGHERIVAKIVDAISDFRRDRARTADQVVGVGVAGQVEPGTGRVIFAPNLQWRDVPLGSLLAIGLEHPVVVLNDVQAAAYGEWRHGAGESASNLVAIFVGTGVGGGIISHDRLVQGCGGSAGEVGHMVIDRHGPQCRCGNRGCLEAFAGGWAIAQRAKVKIDNDAAARRLYRELVGEEGAISARAVAEAAHRDDPLSIALLREAGEALALGSASLVNLFGPCRMVLGGGVIAGNPGWIEVVREGVAARSLPAAARFVEVVHANLAHRAVAIGAACWTGEQRADGEPTHAP